MKRILLLLPLLAVLIACASPLAERWLGEALPDVSLTALKDRPDEYRGKVVLLGGQIILTSVREGDSWIEVLQQPLDWRHRPRATDESQGRFLIRVKDFLDPAIYAAGRSITVVGEYEGTRVLPLKETTYTYPVVSAKDYHLWRPDEGQPSFHFSIGVGGVIR